MYVWMWIFFLDFSGTRLVLDRDRDPAKLVLFIIDLSLIVFLCEGADYVRDLV